MKVLMYPGRVKVDDNPYIEILKEGLQQNGAEVHHYSPRNFFGTFDAMHLHWLEKIFWDGPAKRWPIFSVINAILLLIKVRMTATNGGKIVWTVHNLDPHESRPKHIEVIWRWYTKRIMLALTDVVVMSDYAKIEILRRYPALEGVRFHKIYHPHYGIFYEKEIGRADAFHSIASKDKYDFCAVGFVRPYKQIVEVVDAFRNLDSGTLIIAGDGDALYSAKVADAIELDPRITFFNQRLSNIEVITFIRNSRISVFNFKKILNSGGVLGALSLGSRVLCPASPGLAELAEVVGPEWMRTFQSPLTSAVLQQATEEWAETEHAQASTPNLAAFDPAKVAAAHMMIYMAERQ